MSRRHVDVRSGVETLPTMEAVERRYHALRRQGWRDGDHNGQDGLHAHPGHRMVWLHRHHDGELRIRRLEPLGVATRVGDLPIFRSPEAA